MNNQKLVSPYRGINLQYISDASVCYPGNPISTCVNFTPNTNIKTMSANVYHGKKALAKPSKEGLAEACPIECEYREGLCLCL